MTSRVTRNLESTLLGFTILLNDVSIIWRYKAQRSVTLISSDDKYVALSASDKEVKFMWMLLNITIIEVKLPITLRLDNVGAIFIYENVTTSYRTKHVDTRYRFVNESVEDGFIEIIFVKTKYNVADIFAKNTSGDIGNRHHNKMVKDIETKQEGC